MHVTFHLICLFSPPIDPFTTGVGWGWGGLCVHLFDKAINGSAGSTTSLRARDESFCAQNVFVDRLVEFCVTSIQRTFVSAQSFKVTAALLAGSHRAGSVEVCKHRSLSPAQKQLVILAEFKIRRV